MYSIVFQVAVVVWTIIGAVAIRTSTTGQGDSPIMAVGAGRLGEGNPGLLMLLVVIVALQRELAEEVEEEQVGVVVGAELIHPLVHREVLAQEPLAMATGEVRLLLRLTRLPLPLTGGLTGTPLPAQLVCTHNIFYVFYYASWLVSSYCTSTFEFQICLEF